jgi:hypothetical protein
MLECLTRRYDDWLMNAGPGQELRSKYGMTGILTMPPDKGGIIELLCDMDVCYCPFGRAYFDPIVKPLPTPYPDWIPSEDHFPRTNENGGRRRPGNVRLAHRRCNGDDFGLGQGHDRKRQRALAAKTAWLSTHPRDARTVAAADKRWVASRRVTNVPGLGSLDSHSMTFDGKLVQRGFWLYVWRIASHSSTVIYVGRTGDSSSPFASSPFTRVARHLEVGVNARSNSLLRQLHSRGVDPTDCTFEMMAIGPVFPQQMNMALHRPLRDEIAAQEAALSGLLASRGYDVLGSHPTCRVYDRGLFERIRDFVDLLFPIVG